MNQTDILQITEFHPLFMSEYGVVVSHTRKIHKQHTKRFVVLHGK